MKFNERTPSFTMEINEEKILRIEPYSIEAKTKEKSR